MDRFLLAQHPGFFSGLPAMHRSGLDLPIKSFHAQAAFANNVQPTCSWNSQKAQKQFTSRGTCPSMRTLLSLPAALSRLHAPLP